MVFTMEAVKHVYEVRPREDHPPGADLISDAPPFGRVWYEGDQRCRWLCKVPAGVHMTP
jgi:hypothetical protein